MARTRLPGGSGWKPRERVRDREGAHGAGRSRADHKDTPTHRGQAEGANPFFRLWTSGRDELEPLTDPKTRASAIRIGNPANWPKALRVLRWTEGICESVSDQEIGEAKEALSRDGVGCEPASAATVAGLRKLRQFGRIESDADVVVLLTGHQLKDIQFILEADETSTRKLHLDADVSTAQISRWLDSAD